jgi:iron complex outermembrane receptor protein
VDTPAPPHVVIPINLVDSGYARTYGGEVYGTWSVTGRWRLSPGYSLIHMNASSTQAVPGDTPKHQIQLRSTLGLRSNLDWDTSLYFVGQLSAPGVPAYTRLDMQLRWRVLESVDFSVTGQNLLTARHAEFGTTYGIDQTQVLRSVLGKITWRF